MTADLITKMAFNNKWAGSVYSLETLDEVKIHVPVGQSEMARNFIILLRIVRNLTLMSC